MLCFSLALLQQSSALGRVGGVSIPFSNRGRGMPPNLEGIPFPHAQPDTTGPEFG
jgi:hypothetical protein